MDLFAVMESFSLACAPSGYEREMAVLLHGALSPFCDSVSLDRSGNIIGRIQGYDSAAPKIMVFAHMDSVGFVVRKIEKNGLIQVERLGGIPEKVLPGVKLCILNDDGAHVRGVIGNKPHHAMSEEDKRRVDPIQSLYVDIGASCAAQVRAQGVDAGCFASYAPSYERLLDERICATAVDNRAGCAALVETARLLHETKPACDVYLVGSVWEEYNLRGAMLAARQIHPDIAISIDVCLTGDIPDLASRYDTALGQGPGISYYNFHGRGTLNGTIGHKGLLDLARATAQRMDIPLQRFASIGLLTDAAYVQLEGEGVATIDMCFPARYTHTPVELCDMGDVRQLSFLLHGMLTQIDTAFPLNRYAL